MRVRRLAFRALGPYPGEHTVDLDRLAVSGLFLLCGPTGSGKSTIIDAITFALYGSIEGVKERLHSDHAEPGVEPYVELVFETSAGLYRVWRSPEYQRPKLRGTGTTTQNTQAKLFRLTSEDQIGEAGSGELVSAQASEAGAEIQELVGLSKDQFLQTIVLPQGQFARFLTTKPDERQKLLQTIFNTRVFQETQEYLRTESLQAGESVKKARQAVATALTALWGDREGAPEIVETTWKDTAPLRAAGTELVGGVRGAAARLEAEAAAAKGRADGALMRLRSAQRLTGLLLRRERARAVLASHEEQADEMAAGRARFRRATAAGGLRSTLARADETAASSRTAAAAVTEARARAGGEIAALEREGLDALRDSFRARLTALEEVRGREAALAAQERELERLAQEAAGQRATREQHQQRLDTIPRERSALQEKVTEAAAAEARLPAHAAEVERLSSLEKTALRFAGVEAEAAKAAKRAAAAQHEAEAALRHEMEMRDSWLDGIAGDLAAELQDGRACKVCGSTEHPSPARRAAGSATKETAEAARATRVSADTAVAEALTEANRLVTQAEELGAQLGGRGTAEISAALTAARDGRVLDEVLAAQREDLTEKVGALATEEETLRAAITEAGEALSRAKEQSARISGEVSEARSAVEKARGEHASVSEALDAAGERLRAVESVRAALTEAAAAERDAHTVASSLVDASRDAGFESVEEARAALLPESELRELEATVRTWDAEAASATATLAEEEISALTGAEQPEVERHRAEWEELTALSEQAGDRRGAARRDAEEAARCFHEFEGALDAEAAMAEGVRALVRMARVVQGNNSRSMRLTTYVLLRRFEDVVRAANMRLATMSDGRYELRRADEEGGQRARGQGLGLEVMDYTTGKVRSPHTLSGGETFYTSLALALGLADVVTDESGGIQLGTLFVDEGFGTLDADTLENVMRVLQSLSRGGRAVGIVSHVTELRNQIHEQIQVDHRREGKGSTLTVVA
nr:SMC family ATPase [Actinomycetales bacterium]